MQNWQRTKDPLSNASKWHQLVYASSGINSTHSRLIIETQEKVLLGQAFAELHHCPSYRPSRLFMSRWHLFATILSDISFTLAQSAQIPFVNSKSKCSGQNHSSFSCTLKPLNGFYSQILSPAITNSAISKCAHFVYLRVSIQCPLCSHLTAYPS